MIPSDWALKIPAAQTACSRRPWQAALRLSGGRKLGWQWREQGQGQGQCLCPLTSPQRACQEGQRAAFTTPYLASRDKADEVLNKYFCKAEGKQNSYSYGHFV